MRGKIKNLYGTGYRSKDKGIHMGFYFPHAEINKPNPTVIEEFYIEFKERKNPKFDTIEGLKGKIKVYPRLVSRLSDYWKMNLNEVEEKEGWASLKKMATHSYDKRILIWLKRLVEYFEGEIKNKK